MRDQDLQLREEFWNQMQVPGSGIGHIIKPTRKMHKEVRTVIYELHGSAGVKYDLLSNFTSKHNRGVTDTLRGELNKQWVTILPTEVGRSLFDKKTLHNIFKSWYLAFYLQLIELCLLIRILLRYMCSLHKLKRSAKLTPAKSAVIKSKNRRCQRRRNRSEKLSKWLKSADNAGDNHLLLAFL
jgi:hypothetical protein